MASTDFKRESSEPTPVAGTPYDRFMESMKIDFYKWHDGIGYDLDALNELDSHELKQVEELLISRKDSDWRDVETLAALNTPLTIQALRDTLVSPNRECRLMAARYLKDLNIEDHIEEVVIRTLPETTIGDGMSYRVNAREALPHRQYPPDDFALRAYWKRIETFACIVRPCLYSFMAYPNRILIQTSTLSTSFTRKTRPNAAKYLRGFA